MNERRWLLSVGIAHSGETESTPRLHAGVEDAVALHHALTTEYSFQGVLLADPRDVARSSQPRYAADVAGAGTREDIVDGLNELRRQMRPADLCVVALSGHGTRLSPGYFVPYGGAANRPESLLMYRELLGELSLLPTRRILLVLGCCYAGLAADVSNDPGGLFVLAAAGSSQQALDRVHGPNSPFFAAVLDHLLRDIPPGGTVQLCGLFQAVSHRVAAQLAGVLGAAEQSPCCSGWVVQSPAGQAWNWRRPGFAVVVPTRYHGRVGETLGLGLVERLPNCSWQLVSRNVDLTPAAAGGFLASPEAVRFDQAGEYEFDLVVNAPGSSEPVTRAITIRIREAGPRPLALDPAPFPVCFRGRSYSAIREVTGGHPPYRLQAVEGLPTGLSAKWIAPDREQPFARIELTGVVRDETGAGTAASPHALPVLHPLRFEVTDSLGERLLATRALTVVSLQDYCQIPEGEFEVGYLPTHDSSIALRDFFGCLDDGTDPAHAAESRDLRRIRAEVKAGVADQIGRQLSEENPGGRVSGRRFLMRKYPVTNLAWREYVLANRDRVPPPHLPLGWNRPPPEYFDPDLARLPVVNVPYLAILAYLRWRGTRLATAWEWERSARGTDGRLFPWGNQFDHRHANLRTSGHGRLLPVDAHDQYASPDGVCDLVGNAAEWVERRTFVDGTFHQKFRGGSFRDSPLYALAAKDSYEAGVRFYHDENAPEIGETQFDWLGFRDVVDLNLDLAVDQALVRIPESEVRIGDDRVRVPAFRVARYAVSNREYLDFVLATGHRRPLGWAAEPEAPFSPSDQHLPVAGVTHRDALAYCLWLSRATNQVVRLPRPEQWLAAVQGGEGRRYPWGSDFDPQRCNSRRSGWGRRLPVYALEGGASAHGIFNLVGNVCEWVGRDEVRGGSWQEECRTLSDHGFRQRVQQDAAATNRLPDIGFRYVSPLSTPSTL